ncbi:SGNH/GDSL hydrolase family protein [Agrococcus casei]|uniref:SGNH/GDSL hydrolase family protein n=1 Tax=Agrococcus casei TaxID=343512 RepID=UPI003F9BB53D
MGGVTPHGIRHPDGATKAKNLGPELQTMAEDIDRVFTDTTSNGPWRELVRRIVAEILPENDVLEGAVTRVLETLGIGYDYNSPQYTLAHRDVDGVFSQLRIRTLDGKFPDDVALEMFRRGSALAGGTDAGSSGAPARGFSAFPIFTARMSKSAADGTPAALVYVGSSTTANYGVAAADGYVALLHAAIQSLWPSGGTESTVRVNASADFSRITSPGVHGYNAGQGGTNAVSYLTNAECDKIAALYPSAIFHMVGSNDFKAQDAPATYKARVESRLAYLDSILTDPCQHILIQPYQRVDFTPSTYQWSEYATALREIAASRSNTKVVDISPAYAAVGIPGSDPLGIMREDSVHMVERGYRFMADLLADAVLS